MEIFSKLLTSPSHPVFLNILAKMWGTNLLYIRRRDCSLSFANDNLTLKSDKGIERYMWFGRGVAIGKKLSVLRYRWE